MRLDHADPGIRGPRSFLRRTAAAMAAALAGTLLSVVPQQSADAYAFIGCKWNTTAVIYYVPSPLLSFPVWLNAAPKWGGLDASLTWDYMVSPHLYGTNEGRGNTVVWTGVTRKRGTVQDPPDCPGGQFQQGQVEVVLNWTSISGYSQAQKEGVAAHELGHALGLAHNSAKTWFGAPVAVMYPYDDLRNAFGVSGPLNDDKAGINALY